MVGASVFSQAGRPAPPPLHVLLQRHVAGDEVGGATHGRGVVVVLLVAAVEQSELVVRLDVVLVRPSSRRRAASGPEQVQTVPCVVSS